MPASQCIASFESFQVHTCADFFSYTLCSAPFALSLLSTTCSYRILYNNVVCVAWLTYLSLLTHTKINLLSFLHFTH